MRVPLNIISQKVFGRVTREKKSHNIKQYTTVLYKIRNLWYNCIANDCDIDRGM